MPIGFEVMTLPSQGHRASCGHSPSDQAHTPGSTRHWHWPTGACLPSAQCPPTRSSLNSILGASDQCARSVGIESHRHLYDTAILDDRGNLFLGFSRRPLMFVLPQANLAEPRERYGIANSRAAAHLLSGSMLRQGARRLRASCGLARSSAIPDHVVVPELGLIDLTDLEAAKMLPGVQLLNDSVHAVSARNGLMAIAAALGTSCDRRHAAP